MRCRNVGLAFMLVYFAVMACAAIIGVRLLVSDRGPIVERVQAYELVR